MKRVCAIALAAACLLLAGPPLTRADLLPATAPPSFTLQTVLPTVPATYKVRIDAYTEDKSSQGPWPIYCEQRLGDIQFGTIEFEYAPFTGDFYGGSAHPVGGAIIYGGFKQTGDPCQVGMVPGATFRWLQHVVCSGDVVVDKIDADPNEPGPFYYENPTAAFTATLFDAPCLGVLCTHVHNVQCEFESALVCTYDNTVEVIGSFEWGYTISTTGASTTVTAIQPGQWQDGSESLTNRFNAEYGPQGTVDKGWSMGTGCCCIPTPSALLLTLIGIGVLGVYRRFRRA